MNIPMAAGLRVAQRERMRGFVERRLSRRVDAFVCVSQGVAAVARQQGGVPEEKLHVIPNGIAPQRFADVTPADLSRWGIASDHKVVLCIGRLDHQKGVDVLLNAACKFLPRQPGAALLIVGDGPERAKLTRQVATQAWRQRVVFAPWQSQSLPLIAAADVVAIPSRWEGMSNVLLEAIALGRPVAAADVEGMRDVLSDQGQQWLAPAEDSSALAQVVVNLLSRESETRAIAQANQQRVFSHFTLDNTLTRYANLYRSLTTPGG